jgi:hypothetical protein
MKGGRLDGWTVGTGPALTAVAAVALTLLPTVQPSAQTIDTVVVHNTNIFPDELAEELGFVAKAANALHIRTRAAVIRRTILVGPGDAYDSARVAESERALRALGVFRFVAIDTARRDAGPLALRVVTADGWSTKPQFGFSTAAGDETWEIGLVEENFLGLATTFVGIYRSTPDRNELELQYVSPHFLTRHARLFVYGLDRSDGLRGAWRYGLPFYHTAARRSLVVEGDAADERVLIFRDGGLDTALTRRAVRVGLRGGVALHATNREYTRLWLAGQWRREDYSAEDAAVVPRSQFGAVGAGVEWRRVRFRVLQRFNSYARQEDVNLSQHLRVGLWATPRAWGYPVDRAGVGPELQGQLSTVWRAGFAALRVVGNAIYTSAGLDSGRVRASVTVADQNLPRQTWLLFVEAGVAARPRPGGEFDPWSEGSGPRLFGAHAFTGTRLAWGTLENRILVVDEFSGLVGVGLAPFVDYGGAWYADQAPRYGGNVGLALRLGPTRSVRAEATEIAVGYRFGEGWRNRHWAIAVRKGFVF